MRIVIAATTLVLLSRVPGFPTTALAQGGALPVTMDKVVGRVLTFDDGAVMTYGRNGAFSYQNARGKYDGRWILCNEGAICVTGLGPGRDREDRYISVDGKLYLLNRRGGRFRIVNCKMTAGGSC